jgi:hypothetical protein
MMRAQISEVELQLEKVAKKLAYERDRESSLENYSLAGVA